MSTFPWGINNPIWGFGPLKKELFSMLYAGDYNTFSPPIPARSDCYYSMYSDDWKVFPLFDVL